MDHYIAIFFVVGIVKLGSKGSKVIPNPWNLHFIWQIKIIDNSNFEYILFVFLAEYNIFVYAVISNIQLVLKVISQSSENYLWYRLWSVWPQLPFDKVSHFKKCRLEKWHRLPERLFFSFCWLNIFVHVVTWVDQHVLKVIR